MPIGMPLTTARIFRDDSFPPTHRGIHYNAEECFVDIMDCLTFVCATVGAAYNMKNKLFDKHPVWEVVWNDFAVKRKRVVCKTSSMLKALGMCAKPEAAMLASKLSNLTAIVVSKQDIACYAKEHADRAEEAAQAANKAVEVVDGSEHTSDNVVSAVIAPTPNAASTDCPFYPAENIKGLIYCCTTGLGPEKTKEVMTNVATMQLVDAQDRKACYKKEMCEEQAHKESERKNIAAHEERKRKRSDLAEKLNELAELAAKVEAVKGTIYEPLAKKLLSDFIAT